MEVNLQTYWHGLYNIAAYKITYDNSNILFSSFNNWSNYHVIYI